MAGTKQKEEGEILPMSDNKVEVSYDSVGHRLCAVKGKEKERKRVTTKIFLRAFQPDEEASPEVGQPKRP